MLFKVQYQGKKKYIKQNGASYPEFLNEDSPAPSTCTDTLSLSSQSEECDLSLMSPKRTHVDDAFLMSPKRQHIDDSSSQAKEAGSTYGQKNTEHFFHADSNEGYIAWKLKNTQRELSGAGTSGVRKNSSRTSNGSGPELEREVTEEQQLEGDQCREAISLLKHSTDIEQICMKMRATFKHRQQLIHDPEQCSTVLTVFPRFLDTKGLVLQDFDLLFGAETSSKLLEKWGTLLKAKVMEQAKNLSKTPHLDYLIQCAEENPDEDEEVPEDLETLCFAEHFHSFHVVLGNDANVSMLKVEELRFFKPFDLLTSYGFDRDDQYVVPVHVFV
ncbi:hypothetical protein JOQ06_002998 [Pogonophryne albipinna]|uniref:Uncharacterized protein n=1 Tax=Pogonophryne albipinna TaxID=1090488 RepID=A0AAD6B7R8_9TELE|nr:hypothetical protein JOQ06_002998 [Pogonophryne albipinna]